MNQLFYNIAGEVEHQIRREKRTTISKVIVRVKPNIMQNRNWFYFEFSVESSIFIFNNFKTEKFKLTFEGWNRPVCHLFGFTRVSFCQNLLHFTLEQWSELWWRWCRVSFFSFPASFKNSSPREKVGNCPHFGTGGWSLCFYPLFSQNIWTFFPTPIMAARAKKKNSGIAICSRNQSALSRFGARLRILNLIARLC